MKLMRALRISSAITASIVVGNRAGAFYFGNLQIKSLYEVGVIFACCFTAFTISSYIKKKGLR